MRAKLLGLIVGIGLVAASAASAVACSYHASMASNDQTTQQTASADGDQQPQSSTQ